MIAGRSSHVSIRIRAAASLLMLAPALAGCVVETIAAEAGVRVVIAAVNAVSNSSPSSQTFASRSTSATPSAATTPPRRSFCLDDRLDVSYIRTNSNCIGNDRTISEAQFNEHQSKKSTAAPTVTAQAATPSTSPPGPVRVIYCYDPKINLSYPAEKCTAGDREVSATEYEALRRQPPSSTPQVAPSTAARPTSPAPPSRTIYCYDPKTNLSYPGAKCSPGDREISAAEHDAHRRPGGAAPASPPVTASPTPPPAAAKVVFCHDPKTNIPYAGAKCLPGDREITSAEYDALRRPGNSARVAPPPATAPTAPATPSGRSRPESTTWSKLRLANLKTEQAVVAPDELFRRVSPSVYRVVAAKSVEDLSQRKGVSSGSAVALTERELITNCHVIEDRPLIVLLQGETWHLAELAKVDMKGDRCILRTDATLKPIQAIRSSQDLKVGERAYTIGSPSGLENTLAEGLISGLRQREGARYVQTNAAVSPGSSGGGLFDARANLVGITTFILRDAQNLNFAIAIEEFVSR